MLSFNPLQIPQLQMTLLNKYSTLLTRRYIAVGNEVKPTDPERQNIYNVLMSANLQAQIKVFTSVEPTLLGNSYSPSAGVFREVATTLVTQRTSILALPCLHLQELWFKMDHLGIKICLMQHWIFSILLLRK